MTSINAYVQGFLAANRPMIQYLRDKQNRKVGVLVAFRRYNNVLVGWSKVNEAAGDQFNREYGIARAIDQNRLMTLDEFDAHASSVLPNLPPVYREFLNEENEIDVVRTSQYDDFVYRCKRYFSNRIQNSVSAE
jgi:hypothetical protein